MVRRFAGISIVLALAACSFNTTGTGQEGDTDEESSTVADDGEQPDESVDEQSGDGDPGDGDPGDGDPGCDIGSEGCPCTPGGGCDPGLICDLGVCAPGSSGDGDGDPTTGDGDGDPTTGDGDGDPTTGDGDGDPTTGDGDGDPNFMCTLSNWCNNYNLQNCVCQSCYTNGNCSSSEDCVCPDCTNLNVCKNNCTNNGVCHPYYEGCDCPDCANHPLCQ